MFARSNNNVIFAISLFTIIITISSTLLAAGYPNYSGYQVLKLCQRNLQDYEFFLDLQKQGVYFNIGPISTQKPTSQILLPPEQIQNVTKQLEEYNQTNHGFQWEIIIHDFQKILDLNYVHAGNLLPEGKLQWDRYYPLENIYEYLDTQAKIHSDFMTIIKIGHSFEGRPLKVVKLSKPNQNAFGKLKPAVWIDSLIHSREWITGAVGLFVLDQLINSNNHSDGSSSVEIQSWLDLYDFYHLPVFNPDGYDYTVTTDRLWRKTRSTYSNNSAASCIGTDLNRNFAGPDLSAEDIASKNPCSGVYSGPFEFSEPEAAAVRNFIQSISKELVFYLSLHSYRQVIMFPYASSDEPIPQYETYLNITKKAAKAHARRNGTNFTPGKATDFFSKTYGSSLDWVKSTFNTTLALAYELRDKGEFGPYLPSNQIYDSSVEFMDGFHVLMQELTKLISNKYI